MENSKQIINWDNEIENLKSLVKERISTESIAKKYDVSETTIRRKLEKFNIVRDGRSIINSEKNKKRDEEIIKAVKESTSIRKVLETLKLPDTGGHRTWIKKKIISLKLDTSHFLLHPTKGKKGKPGIGNKKIELKDILVENSTYQTSKLKKRLIEEGLKEQKCECCGNTEWNGKPIPLQIHHINGDHFDNRIENLQVLCPNCHSQTDNFGSKNKTNNIRTTTPLPKADELIEKLKEVKYIYRVADYYKVSEGTIRKWIQTLNIRDKVNKLIKDNSRKPKRG